MLNAVLEEILFKVSVDTKVLFFCWAIQIFINDWSCACLVPQIYSLCWIILESYACNKTHVSQKSSKNSCTWLFSHFTDVCQSHAIAFQLVLQYDFHIRCFPGTYISLPNIHFFYGILYMITKTYRITQYQTHFLLWQ